MRTSSFFHAGCLAVLLSLGVAPAMAGPADGSFAVGPQYDTSHVYVDPAHVDAFASSFLATFGGTSTRQVVATVTPTASRTTTQLIRTPVGTVSLFGFQTPIPYPFGAERTGYLVSDIDAAVAAARAAGASVLVDVFTDPIGRDAVIQWPGGVNMQLYWHAKAPDYPAFRTVPENRVYLPADAAPAFLRDFLSFSKGEVISDDGEAPGVEVGAAGTRFRRVRLASPFGRMTLLITDGHLPYPYGHETTGYEVEDLPATLDKATASGARVLVEPFESQGRTSAMVRFPGGYIAEIHAVKAP